MDPITLAPQIPNTETNQLQFTLKLTTIDRIGGISCNICRITLSNKKEFDIHYLEHKTGKPTVYTCVICKKEISNYISFRGHCYNNHVLQEEIRCDKCDKVFRRHTALKLHYEAVHLFKCNQPSCSQVFSTKKDLHLHDIVHNKKLKPPFNCNQCGEQIPTLDACKSHISEHVTIFYTCPICDEDITKEEAYKHINIHFDETPSKEELLEVQNEVQLYTGDTTIESIGGILCTYCSQLYPDKAKFDEHFSEQHPGNKILYTCNICNKNHAAYSFLVYHCYEHVTKGKFECDSCDKSFPRLSLLSFHVEAYHSNDENDNKPLKCIGCNLKFAKEERLRNHMREKHDIWQLSCPEQGCEMEFQTPKELLMHQKTHKKSQKNCKKCGLMFTSLISCLKHIELHKKYMYSCSVCRREYYEKLHLLNHLPEHFETVLHMCNVCGKAYTKKSRLAAHAQSHAAVKKHICSHCGKGFDKMCPYKLHLMIHTGLKPFNCTECPKSFACKGNYRKHVARMHKFLNKDNKKTDEKHKHLNEEVITTNAIKQKPEIRSVTKETDKDKTNDKVIKTSVNETNIRDEIELLQMTYKYHDSKGDIESGIESVCSEMDTNIFECDNDFNIEKIQTNEITSEIIENNLLENMADTSNTSFSYYSTDIESGIDSVSSEVENFVVVYDEQNTKPDYVQPIIVKRDLVLQKSKLNQECGEYISMIPVLGLLSEFDADPPVQPVTPLEPLPREYGPDFVTSVPVPMNKDHQFVSPELPTFTNNTPDSVDLRFTNTGLEFENNSLPFTSPLFANTSPEFANTAPEFANDSLEFANAGAFFPNAADPEFATELGNSIPEFLNTCPEFMNNVMDTTASGECIPLDDHLLPHIDPNLTINYEQSPYEQNLKKWEPIITKLYHEYYGTDSNVLMNTDIF